MSRVQSERTDHDAAHAAEARARLRREGVVPIEPDELIGVMLRPDEQVISVRRGVSLERRKERRDLGPALSGDLYLTTTRIVCVGEVAVDLPLLAIRDAIAADGVLRLDVGDGRGVEIRTGDPLLLRVEIAAARQTARAL